MKRALSCVVLILVAGCISPLSDLDLNAIAQKAHDSPQDAGAFKAANPKIQAQLKDGPDKAATIRYLDSLETTLENNAKSDQYIWKAIKAQHSK